MNNEEILLTTALLFLLSILSSKIAEKTGFPALILFLFIGILAGSDGPGGIYFDDPHITQLIGIIALILILFNVGSIDGALQSIKSILWVELHYLP